MLEAIYRHPVKGLAAEPLERITLAADQAMPWDRIYAIAHARSRVDRTDPVWMPRRNFLVVAHSPKLAAIQCRYDEHRDALIWEDVEGATAYELGDVVAREKLARRLEQFAGPTQSPPLDVLRIREGAMTDSPTATVSILNLASVRALEHAIGAPLDRRRFRGNLWVDVEPAWCERTWVGRELAIGKVRFAVREPIERCNAINADPATGELDQNLPRLLRDLTGEPNFGCLADVLTSAAIHVGDRLESG